MINLQSDRPVGWPAAGQSEDCLGRRIRRWARTRRPGREPDLRQMFITRSRGSFRQRPINGRETVGAGVLSSMVDHGAGRRITNTV